METPVFYFFIVPNGFSADRQKFTLCFEINNNHPDSLSTASDVLKNKWKTAVGKYPVLLNAAKSKFKKVSIRCKTDADTDIGVASELDCSYDDAGIDEASRTGLWNVLIGNADVQSVNGGVVNAQLNRLKTTQPVITDPDTFEFSPASVINSKIPVTVLDVDGAPLLIANKGQLSVQEFESHLTKVAASSGSSKKLDAGITQQAEIVIQKNKNRFEQIQRDNKALFDNTTAELQKIQLGGTASASLQNTEQANFVEKILSDHRRMETAKFITTSEPEYIKNAIDKINEHLAMRKIIGTVIEFTVSLKILNEIIKGCHHFELEMLDKSFHDSDDYAYFEGHSSSLQRSSIEPGMIIAAESNRHIGTILKIGRKCKIVDYDSESVARNTEEALARTTREWSGQQASVVQIELATNIAENFFAKKGPSISEFNQIQASMRSLQRVRSINQQVTDLQTKGLAVFLELDPIASRENELLLNDNDLIKGYVILARKTLTKKWYSLTACYEEFLHNGTIIKPQEPQELGISSGAVVQTASSSGDGSSPGSIKDPFFFLWDGTTLSSRNPMQQEEKITTSAGETDYFTLLKERNLRMHDASVEYFAVAQYQEALFGVDWFPFMKYDLKPKNDSEKSPNPKTPPLYLLKRQYIREQALKLKFGDCYEFLAIAQYRNGFVPLQSIVDEFNKNPASLNSPMDKFSKNSEDCKTIPADPQNKFRRHDHIRDMIISLGSDIYDKKDRTLLLSDHLGESNADLVIRSVEHATSSTCERYILPPKIPKFELYLWYDRGRSGQQNYLNDRDLSVKETFQWFKKFQCQRKGDLPCPKGCADACDTMIQDNVYPSRLNYLPDPVVTGFMIRFFLDAERTVPANNGLGEHIKYPDTFCDYKKGNYPQLKPWLLRMKNDSDEGTDRSKIQVNRNAQEITVKVRRGLTLFADIVPTFDNFAANFHPNIPFDKSHYIGLDKETNLYYDSLYSNISGITLTHASRYPLFAPDVSNFKIVRYSKANADRKEQNIKVVADVNFEHLNLWNGISIPGISPTGEFELYALWDDYSNNNEAPVKSIKEKKDSKKESDGFIKIGSLVFNPDTRNLAPLQMLAKAQSLKSGEPIDPQKHFVATIEFLSDNHFAITHCSDVIFKLRQTSKFTGFFPEGRELVDEKSKEKFSLWSEEYNIIADEFKSFVVIEKSITDPESYWAYSNILFNNCKPKRPQIEKIVPIIVEDLQPKTKLAATGNRIRIYFKKDGRTFTGKFERIGVIVNPGASDKPGIYQTLFKNEGLFSQCAADAVTDRIDPDIPIMTKNQFVLDVAGLEKEYIDKFKPLYEPNLPETRDKSIGLVTYQPKFDHEQELWYIEPELNILDGDKPLHCAWVQLTLVTFNALSPVYPTVKPEDNPIEADYRISEPVRADFTYLYSQRTVNNPHMIFKKPKGEGAFTFTCHVNTLFIKNGVLASQFFISIEKKKGELWEAIDANLDNYVVNGKAMGYSVNTLQYFPLLPLYNHYDELRSKSIEISLTMQPKASNSNIRVVITEIEFHHASNTLADVHKLLEVPGIDFAQIAGVRPINNIIIYR